MDQDGQSLYTGKLPVIEIPSMLSKSTVMIQCMLGPSAARHFNLRKSYKQKQLGSVPTWLKIVEWDV